MTTALSIEELTAHVEQELREVLSSRDMPLYTMMTYHLGWQDQLGNDETFGTRSRRHGVACLSASQAAGGDVEKALPSAAAVELVDSFTEIHDDVQGGSPQRHGRDAVWWVWGPAQAINAGDGMHALARLALFRLQTRGVSAEDTFRAVQVLDAASLELCEGRFKDLEAQERIDLSIDGYLDMATGKTGALYSCAMRLGAFIAGADETVVKALGITGTKLGVAAQVRSDVEELWGDDASPEVLNKKKMLPVVHALENAKISEKRRLGDVYFKRVLEPQDVVAVRQVLEELGSKKFCEGLVDEYRSEALASASEAGLDLGPIGSMADALLAAD